MRHREKPRGNQSASDTWRSPEATGLPILNHIMSPYMNSVTNPIMNSFVNRMMNSIMDPSMNPNEFSYESYHESFL